MKQFSTSFWLLFLLTAFIACKDDDELLPEGTPFESFPEGVHGCTGMALGNTNELAVFNSAEIAILGEEASLISKVDPVNLQVRSVVYGKDRLFAMGNRPQSTNTEVGVLCLSISGAQLWEYTAAVSEESLEAMHVAYLNDEVIAAFVVANPDMPRVVRTIVLNPDGEEQEVYETELPVDNNFYANQLFVDTKYDYVVQGSPISNDGSQPNTVIFKYEGGVQSWQVSMSPSGFESVRKIVKSSDGQYLVLGNKQQVHAWAFLLDQDGNILWNNMYGDETGKNWIYDAAFDADGIVFCGYTTANAEGVAEGLVISCDANGNLLEETRYGDELDNRIYAMGRRQGELLFAGWRMDTDTGDSEAWVFSKIP